MAHVYAVRAVLPGMLEREEGYLLHTASMAGILTSQGNLTYATTKHAVVGLAEWLSISYHDKGVRTSLLAPLGVNTPMLGGTDSAFARTAAGGGQGARGCCRYGSECDRRGEISNTYRRNRPNLDGTQDQ